MQNPIDPSLPQTFGDAELHDTAGFLDTVLDTLLDPATAPLLDTGHALWRGLTILILVWTGLRIAFSGSSWNAREFLELFMTVFITYLMLQFYATPLAFPGVAREAPPFPLIIPAGGTWLADRFEGDTVAVMQTGLLDLYDALSTRLTNIWNATSLTKVLILGSNAVLNFIVSLAFLPIFALVLILVFSIGYAQVIYATFAIALFVFLGPVMIPFLVFPPLSFLFWSWLKALFTFSLYGVIAACLLRVWCGIGLTFVRTLIEASAVTGSVSISEYGNWIIAIIPFAVAAIYSTMQVGTLAGMLTGAGGGGGMGGAVVSGATMLASGGKSAVLKGVPKA